MVISIHAPGVGGDYAVNSVVVRREYISIHAPREGGDTSASNLSAGVNYFNPRPREGGDQEAVGRVRNMLSRISIHAPARGAT